MAWPPASPFLFHGRPRIPRNWLFAGVALAILLGLAAFLYTHSSQAPPYVTARVDRGDIDSTVTTTGNLNAVISVQVGSQVSGNIIALYADFNTKVKKGQLVAEIDPAPFKAAVEQAAATLKQPKPPLSRHRRRSPSRKRILPVPKPTSSIKKPM